MSKPYIALTGISYLCKKDWQVAVAGDEIEIDAQQVKDALERGIIKAAATPKAEKPVSSPSASEAPPAADVPK